MKRRISIISFAVILMFSKNLPVMAADLSIHDEALGDFYPYYYYENPFKGKETGNGVNIKFHAGATGDIRVLGTIFAISGVEEPYAGRMYFTPGSYFGYNAGNYGGFFDANLKEYGLVHDYIGEEAEIEIIITEEGFAVYADGELCYDQTILDDPERSSSDLVSKTDFSQMLEWLAHAEYLSFGQGSWWNSVGFDEANIELSEVFFSLLDGTPVGSYFTENEINKQLERPKPEVVEIPEDSEKIMVDEIDVSFHMQSSGNFTSVYTYDNPFKGADISNGAIIEFTAKSTGDVRALGTIFAIHGKDAYDGRIYFTSGSYLGYNSALFGGFFDANLKDYLLVEDYIGEQADIKIELSATGFTVYANGVKCYDQSILDDESRGKGDFSSTSDFTPMLEWLANADSLYFGYGSFWNSTGYDEANILLSNVAFSLPGGTVLADEFPIDDYIITAIEEKKAAELLKEDNASSVEAVNATVQNVSVNIDWDDVEYEGYSVIPLMIMIVSAVAVIAFVLVIATTRKREYK